MWDWRLQVLNSIQQTDRAIHPFVGNGRMEEDPSVFDSAARKCPDNLSKIHDARGLAVLFDPVHFFGLAG